MIQVLTDFPDNAVAASASGITRHDYQECLVSQVELALKRHPKIRCYYELGPQFSRVEPGAMWEDFKVEIEHLSRWERVSVVSDVDWIKDAVNAFRFLMPGEVRVFATSEAAAAREWIRRRPFDAFPACCRTRCKITNAGPRMRGAPLPPDLLAEGVGFEP